MAKKKPKRETATERKIRRQAQDIAMLRADNIALHKEWCKAIDDLRKVKVDLDLARCQAKLKPLDEIELRNLRARSEDVNRALSIAWEFHAAHARRLEQIEAHLGLDGMKAAVGEPLDPSNDEA